LKGVTEDFEQQVQIVRLLPQDDALEIFNGNYIDPVIAVVHARAANNVQEATCKQTRPTDTHCSTEPLKGYWNNHSLPWLEKLSRKKYK
jgi:hypothetical protein